eukprot:CAMPEP_0113934824 /NCGR_PEP_ID=MMETSP1339-20121228/2086_1 /TAXON_ID=94617 /ORGANISM="Fibrocapsa japonica" /LENGTH=406 /DNA_ID=CAMNT_0000936765 /DNA_START=317 /DNA_END=1537 /DNA_ORIENTATION=- /assembly_acc=CAM_ASM_000762
MKWGLWNDASRHLFAKSKKMGQGVILQPASEISQLKAPLEISLDQTLLPTSQGPFNPVVLCGTLLLVLAVLSLPNIIQFLFRLGMQFARVMGAVLSPLLAPIQKWFPELVYQLRLVTGSCIAIAEQVHLSWKKFLPMKGQEEVLGREDWGKASLVERIKLGEGPYLKYKFKLDNRNQVLPLELGQDIYLCGLDPENTVQHGSYHPLSPRRQKGEFEIVGRSSRRGNDGALMSQGAGHQQQQRSQDEDMFSRVLDTLAIGDELAVRVGRKTLAYRGSYSPISDLTLVASGATSILPILQLIRDLLPSSESSVKTATVVWINESSDDFVLYKDLEAEFFKYHRKLDVSCVIDRDLYGHDLTKNIQIQEAIPEFHMGTMAVITGPDYFADKMKALLGHLGYPEEYLVVL